MRCTQAAAAAPSSPGSSSQQNAAANVLHDTHLPQGNKAAAAAHQSMQQPTVQQAAAHSGAGAAPLKGVESTKNVSSRSSSSSSGSQLAETLAMTKATVARQLSVAQQEYQQTAVNVTSEYQPAAGSVYLVCRPLTAAMPAALRWLACHTPQLGHTLLQENPAKP